MQGRSFSRAAERRAERRQQIVDTASLLFSEQGYENVTLRAIAEKLGYAHAALYRYFPDKASLLAEICKETFDQLVLALDVQQSQVEGPEANCSPSLWDLCASAWHTLIISRSCFPVPSTKALLRTSTSTPLAARCVAEHNSTTPKGWLGIDIFVDDSFIARTL